MSLKRFRGRTALLVLVTKMFSPTALVVGIFREIVHFKLMHSYLAKILNSSAFSMALSIWILSGFFASFPATIEKWLLGELTEGSVR